MTSPGRCHCGYLPGGDCREDICPFGGNYAAPRPARGLGWIRKLLSKG